MLNKEKKMKLSKNDLAAVGIQALLGAFVAGMSGLAILYSERKSGALLSCATDALHCDRVLLSYSRELERRTKHIDVIGFLQTIDAMDRIVAIRIRLQETRKATKQDADEAFTQLARLHETMKSLVQNCQSKMTVKEGMDLESLATKTVENGIDNHIRAITVLTKHCV